MRGYLVAVGAWWQLVAYAGYLVSVGAWWQLVSYAGVLGGLHGLGIAHHTDDCKCVCKFDTFGNNMYSATINAYIFICIYWDIFGCLPLHPISEPTMTPLVQENMPLGLPI